MWNFLQSYLEWLLLAILALVLAGCQFHGEGTTQGKRSLGLSYTIDTSLSWVTEADGTATNEETLGIEWTGLFPPAPDPD